MKRFNFKSAVWASIIATIVMTIWMGFFGMNILKVLGMTAGMTGTMMYVIGGIIHLVVGIFWGIIYAWLFEPWMSRLPGFLSGALFSLLPFILAILFFGTFANAIRGIFGVEKAQMHRTEHHQMHHMQSHRSDHNKRSSCPTDKPCPEKKCDEKSCPEPKSCPKDCPENKPCPSQCPETNNMDEMNSYHKEKTGYSHNYGAPCHSNPCESRRKMQEQADEHADEYEKHYSCHSRYMGAKKSHPCKAGGGLPMWLWSLINHVVYGVVLGIFYRPKKPEGQS